MAMKKWEPSFYDEQDGGVSEENETLYHKMSEIDESHSVEILCVGRDADGSDSVLLGIYYQRMVGDIYGNVWGGASVWLTPPELDQLIEALKEAKRRWVVPNAISHR